MRAKEWVSKFRPDKTEDFYKAYAEETAKLIADRTKGSGIIALANDKKIDSTPTAVQGALREQRQKWNAICRSISSLIPEMFDTLLNLYLPDVTLAQQKYRESLINKEEVKALAEEVKPGKPGRKLVK